MKAILVIIIAAATGAVAGSLFSYRLLQRALNEKVETRQLVLVDERNQPVARLENVDGTTALRFIGNGLKTAVQIGVHHQNPGRFLHFFGEDGEISAALNTHGNGDSTLVFADRTGTRVILGAKDSDIPSLGQPAEAWGLIFRKPRSTESLVDININTVPDPKDYGASLTVTAPYGKRSSLP